MRYKKMGLALAALAFSAASMAFEHNNNDKCKQAKSRDDETTLAFRELTKSASWELLDKIEMNGWQTFHTQGLLKIGDAFYVSAVEILEGTEKFGSTDALYDFSLDRTTGQGRAWVFKFDINGNILGQVELSDGDVFHPGGMDFDGESIWVPVAEYRPNSASNVFRLDPETLQAELVFSENDHIGGVVYNQAKKTVHGVSWGSRRLYTWKIRGNHLKSEWEANTQHSIDYQDCHYAGVSYMLCGGLNKYDTPLGKVAFGGLELVDLTTNRPEHQVPVTDYIDEGDGLDPELIVSNNAFWAEPTETGMQVYFMTERDNQAELLIYQVTPWQK